jgi:hypothetical protein
MKFRQHNQACQKLTNGKHTDHHYCNPASSRWLVERSKAKEARQVEQTNKVDRRANQQ